MNLRVTCVQTDVVSCDPEANRKHIEGMIKGVEGTDVIVLPETFTTGFPVDAEKYAEPLGGVTMAWMRNMAKEKDCVVCGTIVTKREEDGKTLYFNSFIWMQPDGGYHIYNKRHLFKMGGEVGLNEGGELLTIEYKGWRIRPFVCYDMRFPVWNRNGFKDGRFEYDLAIYSAEWPEKKAYIWKTLLAARAIENQAYIVGVNRVGVDERNISYSGDCLIINMKGRVVAKAEEGEGVFSAILNKDDLDAFRDYFVVARDWDDFEITGTK
ncbi:MAG: nitrilase-related carbon-nitrogen hydrolase [Candidatus Limimorpha sp.]